MNSIIDSSMKMKVIMNDIWKVRAKRKGSTTGHIKLGRLQVQT